MGVLAPIGMALMPAVTSMMGGAAASAATAGAASIGASALGTGMGVAGSLLSGVSSFEQGMFQAHLASYNEQLAAARQGQVLQAGQIAQSEQLMKTGKEVGAAKAAQAAGNIDIGTGSASAVQAGIEAAGKYDAATLRYNMASQVYGEGQQRLTDRLQATADKTGAWAGLLGGIMGAGSSFMSGASSIADKWAQMGTTGALNVPLTGSVATSGMQTVVPINSATWGSDLGS